MPQRTALVIDDEPDITTYLETLLADAGWTVKAANSSAAGLALFEQVHPDVVILDIMMPERGGLSTLVAIRKHAKLGSTPVVLLTGVQEYLTADYKAFLDRVKSHKADAYLEKPVDPPRLLKTLDQVTAKK